jgi:4-amino-4-deoxy-L-arabinose transferase-like glycosyltransferase
MSPVASLKVPQEFRAVLALLVILTIGAVLRLHDVDSRTLNHPEVYAPGIDLPWGLSNPNPRFTLAQTLKGSIAGEPHPPGYYILMLGWTKLLGSSILALRLPSVLFGIGSILLVYLLALHLEDSLTALLAAAMLALNGLNLQQSQSARMYSMACFLGLLSTVLLVILARRVARPLTYCVLYVIVTLAGLATHVYFWPLFMTQALWVFAAHVRTRGSLLGLLRLQVFTAIVATPLIAIVAYQSGVTSPPPTLAPVDGVLRFLQFGSLFEIDPLAISEPSVNAVAAILALLATVLLLASALRRKGDGQLAYRELTTDVQGLGWPPRIVVLVTGILMAASILLFAYVARTLLPGRSTHLVIATSVLPLALVFVDAVLCAYQDRLKGQHTRVAPKHPWPAVLQSLCVLLAVLPVGIVAAISIFKPIFVQRGTAIFAPYLLIVLASGLATLVRRDRRWIGLAVMLGIIHGLSLLYFKSKPPLHDYKALAERWVSHIEDSDLIFVQGRGYQDDWAVAPIYYYLNARRYHYVGRDFVNAVQSHPQSRVWVLSLPPIPTELEAVHALAGYEARNRFDAHGIFAELYVPKRAAP